MRKLSLVIVVAVLQLSACAEVTPAPRRETSSYCLEAPFAFPAYVTVPTDPNVPTPVPPPENWIPQLTTEITHTGLLNRDVLQVVARSSDELWLVIAGGTLVRFQPSSQELMTYTIKIDNNPIGTPIFLHLASTGILWGFGVQPLSADSYVQSVSYLSRFDEQAGTFVPVLDQDGLLAGFGPSHPSQVAEDAHGTFWITFDNQLIRFDPESRQGAREFDDIVGYSLSFVAADPDGSIWFSTDKYEPWGQTHPVIRLDPSTGRFQDFGSPPEAKGSQSLYFDQAGRLWVSDYGWLEVPASGEPIWYQIARSPIFIYRDRDRSLPHYYNWVRPGRVYESTDGRYWFESIAGLATLEFTTGQWCMLSTMRGAFDEDNEQNMWFAAGGQIYKYHLEP